MSYRYGNDYQAPPQPRPQAPTGVPDERRLMIGLLIGFLVVALVVLLAGRVPFKPNVTPLSGPTAAEYQAEARTLLGSYGYTLEGTVHIPIDRAMDLIAERGLPVRDNPSPTP
jgi:hypothetical protein